MDLLWTTLSEFPGEAGTEKPAFCSVFKIKKAGALPHITRNGEEAERLTLLED